MEKATVLIVSDDAEFVDSIVQSWNRSSCLPEFVVSPNHDAEFPGCTVAVLDGPDGRSPLASDVVLTIAVTGSEALPNVADAGRRLLQIRRSTGWADVVAVLASETVLRVDAQQRAAEAEQGLRESERFTALGRFIAEARHGLGNALTSVLGNSELVLLETESGLRDEVRAQLETIHAMSLKIHETLQGLSSLDREMQMAERQAEREMLCKPARAAASR